MKIKWNRIVAAVLAVLLLTTPAWASEAGRGFRRPLGDHHPRPGRGLRLLWLVNQSCTVPKDMVSAAVSVGGQTARSEAVEAPDHVCGHGCPRTRAREEGMMALAEYLPDTALAYLQYRDLSAISGSAFQSAQLAVTN